MKLQFMKRILQMLSLVLLCGQASTSRAESTLSLAGDWRFQLDPQNAGLAGAWQTRELADTILLPNTISTAAKGIPLNHEAKLDKETLKHLHQRYAYVGPAWYQRNFELPADWKDKDVQLFLERVLWETKVWLNGQLVGEFDSLSVPHRYDLTPKLKPGKNQLTIRVDNRKKYDIGIGHAYTEETQTIWNGIIGRIELSAREKVHVARLQLRPDLQRCGVAVTLELENHTGQVAPAELSLKATPEFLAGHDIVALVSGTLLQQSWKIEPGLSTQTVFYPMPSGHLRWSEFTPRLYVMTVNLKMQEREEIVKDTFGMREFKAVGRQLVINGNPTFLRGTLECCIFPKTGHPPMGVPQKITLFSPGQQTGTVSHDDGKQWERIFSTARAYGLNHLRFHSWCPPEAAFQAADRQGFYLHIELPNWSFKMGQVPPVDDFFRYEGERIIREYGNHPSFVMLCLGNELTGDFTKMDVLIAHFRKLEPTLLYTSTAFSFSPRGKLPGPNDDYFISQQTQSGWVRGQGFLNQTKPNTDSDYRTGLQCLKVPLVTHEVGQYNVFPNLAEIPKYEGALRNLGYEAIRADLEKKGLVADAVRYTRDSGKLAALLYKEDIERALRTKDQAGIALLDLHDFPGQSTATVGLLDAFWDSKGLITPEEFRRFCGPTVPLVRMPKMVYQNTETFEGTVEIAHYGAAPLSNVTVIWTMHDGARTIGQGQFKIETIPLGNGIPLGRIQKPLSEVTTPKEIKLTVQIPGKPIGNDWSIWVYPGTDNVAQTNSVQILEVAGEPLYESLREGKKVLLLPAKGILSKPLDGRFIPVFWSPLHFPNQPGTLGATIDKEHAVWQQFPTSTHTDWHWWELLATSVAVDLDGVRAKPAMPFRFVDKYDRNALPTAIFEVKVGKGRLLVCTLDILSSLETRLAARQLRRSIIAYMNSDEFQPNTGWTEAEVKALFREVKYVPRASSEHADYSVSKAVDGHPETFWHTDWHDGPKLPATFALDLLQESLLKGFIYTPRPDMDRGRISSYSIEVSQDGKNWLPWLNEAKFPNNKLKQTITFAKPIKARFLRITALSDHGKAEQAAIAEMEPIISETSPDVRDLGIVPGFNDKK
jgi:hypothetical protein